MNHRASVIGLAALIVCGVSGVPPLAAEPTPGYATIQRAFLREDFTLVATLAPNFLGQSPESAEAVQVSLWFALSLERLQRTNESLQELERIERRLPPEDPLWPEVLFWDGEVSRRAIQMVRARLAYQRLVERYGDSKWSVQALAGLGYIAMHQQSFEMAAAFLHEAALRSETGPVARDARLFEGICQLRLKSFERAAGIFRSLLAHSDEPPLTAQTAFHLGESLAELGRYDEAVAAYQRAAAAAPNSPWGRLAVFGEGWADYHAGRCEESVQALDRYLSPSGQAEEDHHPEALFAQGNCFLRLGQEDAALASFGQLLSRYPTHPLAFEGGLASADLYRRQEQWLSAKELLHTLLRWPISADARAQVQLQLGHLALDQGNPAQASTVFHLAAESKSLAIRQAALSGLGDVERFLGHLPQATHAYEEAIALAPDTTVASYATYQLGRVELQRGAAAQAVARFQQLASQADPALADEARLALVIAYMAQHEDVVARSLVNELRRGPRTSATVARAAYYQALLALANGEDARAQQLCAETLRHAPRSDEALQARLLLADARLRSSSPREVRTWLQAAYADSLPRSHRAAVAKRLGDLARSDGAYAEAIRWYEAAETLWPSLGSEVAYQVASCYEEGGDVQRAVDYYQLIEPSSWHVRGQLAAERLLERAGRTAEAEAILARLASQPIPEAEAIQERLTELRGAEKERR